LVTGNKENERKKSVYGGLKKAYKARGGKMGSGFNSRGACTLGGGWTEALVVRFRRQYNHKTLGLWVNNFTQHPLLEKNKSRKKETKIKPKER